MRKILLITLFALTGCTSKDPVCDVAKRVSGLVAAEVATQLECKNKAAIEETIVGLLKDNNVCKSSAQSVIGEMICPSLVGALINGAMKQIPSKWECSGGKAADGAYEKLLEVCKRSI